MRWWFAEDIDSSSTCFSAVIEDKKALAYCTFLCKVNSAASTLLSYTRQIQFGPEEIRTILLLLPCFLQPPLVTQKTAHCWTIAPFT